MRTWRSSVDRVVLACIVFVIATMAVAASGSGEGLFDSPFLATLLFSQASIAVLCCVAMRSGEIERHATASVCLALVGLGAALALVASAEDLPGYASHTLSANAVQLVHLAAIGFGVRAATGVATILATLPVSVIAMTVTVHLSVLQSLDRWVLPACASMTVLIVLSHMRAAADRADDLVVQAQEAAVAARTAANAEFTQDEARRIVHDQIITALRAIELERPAAQVRDDVARALMALEGSPASATDIASELQRSAKVRVEAAGPGWPTPPPPRVVRAFHGAAAEALRNVERHAGATSAGVLVDEEAGTFRLEIRDAGRGIVSGTRKGFGIRESVEARMDEVGGIGTVASGPAGTTVRLTWPAEVDFTPSPTTATPLPHRAVYLWTAAPSILTNAYLAARFPGTPPWAGPATWAAIGALMLALAHVLGRRSSTFGQPVLGIKAVLGVALALCCAVGVGVESQSHGALLSAESWVVGYGAAALVLLSFGTPPRLAAVGIGALILTVAISAWRDPTLSIVDPVGALVTCLTNGGAAIVATSVFRHASRATARAVALNAAQEEERAWRTEFAVSRAKFLARLDDDILPFLKAVEQGTAVDAPRTAAVLAAQCRDELGVAEPLPESTREIVRAARTRGVVLSIRATDRPGLIPDAAWRQLEIVLTAATDTHVVTVVPPFQLGQPVRITCVPPLSSGSVRGDVVSDELRTLVLVWSDPPTALTDLNAMDSVP